MAHQASESTRRRTPWEWGGAIVVLGALTAVLVGSAGLLWQSTDLEALLQPQPTEPPLPVKPVLAGVRLAELTSTVPWTAYLYESDGSAQFFFPGSLYGELTARWDSLLTGAGAGVRRVSGATAIDSVRAGKLLVIPVAVCLGKDERDAIRRHVDRGGHLLSTWALGARDEACEWLGYEFLGDLAEAGMPATTEGHPPQYITVPSGAKFSAGLPPGVRIELQNEPWVALRASPLSIFWSDWALNPVPGGPAGDASAAAVAGTAASGGRFAWFGYRLNVGATERDQRLLDRLAQNAALWAAGHILAEVGPWPNGRAAMAVTQDVEHGFHNSRRLARRFQRLGVPVTFFVVTELVMENPDLAYTLLTAGEVGTHGADHRQVPGWPLSDQLASLSQARDDLVAWTGEAPLGFKPPRELYDSLTLEAWRRLGGLYIAAMNDARTAAPELYHVQSGPVVLLPRVVDDDYSLMILQGQTSPDSLYAAWRRALSKVRSIGGLYLLTLHSQLMDSDRHIAAVEAVVGAAHGAGDVWIARESEVADWWLRRSELVLRVQERADRSAVLTVRNGGPKSISSVWLQVYLPEQGLTYAAPEVGDLTLESEYAPWGLRVRLPALGPGESLDILVPRLRA